MICLRHKNSSQLHLHHLIFSRRQLFERKHKENKIPDLSSLPPCQEVLRLHAKRANRIAFNWKRSTEAMITHSDISEHGWFASGDIIWIIDGFPSDIEELLIYDDDDDESFYESEVESEDDFEC